MIDFDTPIGRIRALINDVNEEEPEFSDDQIEAYYKMSYECEVQGAIMALRALVAKYSATGGNSWRLDTIEYEEGKSKASNFQTLLNNLEQSIKDGTNPMCVGEPKVFGVLWETRKENYKRMCDGEIIPPKTNDYEYDLINRTPNQYGVYDQG